MTVAVIGNGPVGQTAALLLARWHVPVVMLDGRPERDLVGSKSICQQRDVIDVWDAVGAGEQIAQEGLTWTTARTFYRDAELFSLTLPDAGRSRFPAFVNLSQSRTEQILDRRIAIEPRIEVRWGHRVTGIAQDAGGVTLRCATGAGVAEIRATHAVACAGARGDDVRGELGVTLGGRSFADKFLICDIRADLAGWASERRFYFDPAWNPGRQVLIHPCPGSTFRIDWQVPGDFDLAAETASGGLDRRIRAIVGDAPYEVVWSSVYRFSSRLADRMRVGRVLLAGDCAHLVAPFGARGLNSGVADAENAAWKIAFDRNGWGGERLLASYHDERYAAAAENLQVTTATMDFLVPQDEVTRAHRLGVLDRAVHDVAAHPLVDSGRLSEPFWYTESPLTTPDPSRPFAGRPPRGTVPQPGPGIVVPDLPVRGGGYLRQRCREGLLLLAAPGAQMPSARGLTPAPVRTTAMDDLSGELAGVLGARSGEVWIVRPDAHVAAVLARPDHAALRAAVRRALGHGPPTAPDEEVDDDVLPAAR